MIIVGAAFLSCWALIQLFAMVLQNAMLVTAVVFIVLGLMWGDAVLPWRRA